MKQLSIILATIATTAVVTATVVAQYHSIVMYDNSPFGFMCAAYDYEYTVSRGRGDDRVAYCTNLPDAVLESDMLDLLLENLVLTPA